MLLHFAYAVVLVFGTTLIHATCSAAVLGWLGSVASHHWALRNSATRAMVLAMLVFLMSMAAFLESGLWAGFYLIVGALSSIEDAVYFSLVTFTTLGYGDVTAGYEWRILAAFEAANGIIMFGWTTAIIVAVAHRLFFHHVPGEKEARNS